MTKITKLRMHAEKTVDSVFRTRCRWNRKVRYNGDKLETDSHES